MDEQALIEYLNQHLDVKMIAGAFLISLIFASANLILAQRNGRNPVLWALMGFFFNIVSLIALVILGKSEQSRFLNDEKWKSRKERITNGLAVSLEEQIKDDDVSEVGIKPKLAVFWYYLDKENKRFGPMDVSDLSKLWGKELDESNYVWAEDMQDWQRIKTLPILQNEIKERVSNN